MEMTRTRRCPVLAAPLQQRQRVSPELVNTNSSCYVVSNWRTRGVHTGLAAWYT